MSPPWTGGETLHATPAGRSSAIVTSVAVPAPPSLTTIRYAASSPAEMVPVSASLRTARFGQSTRMVAVEVLSCCRRPCPGPRVAPTAAALVRTPHAAAVVAPATRMVTDSPADRLPSEHLSSPLSIAQPWTAGERPPFTPAGSGSLTVTPVAVPVPVLATTIPNAAPCPAEMTGFSAALTTLTSGSDTAVKHSAVKLVWTAGEYGAVAAGVYRARKQ